MGKKKKVKKPSVSSEKYTVDQLLEKVHELVDNFEFELAEKFCERALSIQGDHADALELAGSIKAEQGDLDSAKKYLLKAIEAKPDDGYSKYMYIGQISQGSTAVDFYLKGIELMKIDLEKQNESASSSSENKLKKIGSQISNAYCSLAEIYLTDSCFDEDAEDKCGMYCEEALKQDPKNADAHLVMCNYLLSKGEEDKAKELITNNFKLWNIQTLYKDDHEDDMLGDNDNDSIINEGFEIKTIIPYSTRMGLARVSFELNLTCKADLILGDMLSENDEDIEVWYLLALVNQSAGQIVNMKSYLVQIQEIYKKLKLETENDEVYNHVCELLKTCEDLSVDDFIEEDTEDIEDTDMMDDS